MENKSIKPQIITFAVGLLLGAASYFFITTIRPSANFVDTPASSAHQYSVNYRTGTNLCPNTPAGNNGVVAEEERPDEQALALTPFVQNSYFELTLQNIDDLKAIYTNLKGGYTSLTKLRLYFGKLTNNVSNNDFTLIAVGSDANGTELTSRPNSIKTLSQVLPCPKLCDVTKINNSIIFKGTGDQTPCQ